MNNAESIPLARKTVGDTMRTDRWWLEPLLTGSGFLLFIIYTTWAMLQAGYYWAGSYLSPLYSPLLFVDPGAPGAPPMVHAWFGYWPEWWPSFIPPSPAIFILAGPLSFRLTCYYYRKFYYRAYFATPSACAVSPLPQKDYKGETHLLLFQNLHRYTLYIAIFYIIVLAYDTFGSCFRYGKFGVGVGTLVMAVNVYLLSGYTLGCHALRHLVGGRLNCFSCPSGQEHFGHKAWKKVTWLNERHMLWAWASMIWVGFTDFYIRMVSMGIWHDFNTWGN